jgi:hypothetical protein
LAFFTVKRLPLFITVATILVLAGGYFIYDKYIKKTDVSAWDVVPSETIFVYEGSACESCLNDLKKSSIITLVKKAVFPSDKDSLKGFTDLILSNFRQGSLISLHITKKDDFDFVFYIPNSPGLETQFIELISRLRKGGEKILMSDREYNGTKIFEAVLKGRTFSWIKIDNVWVSSFTPVLIEDVIRTHNSDGRNFRSQLGGVYQLPTIKNDGGNIYLNLKKVAEWLALFTSDEPAKFLHQFGQSALLDVKVSGKNNFVLNGFCLDSASNPNYILSSFSGQQPVPFNLKHYVSNRTLMFASYGISDGVSFSRDLQLFNQKNRHLQDTLRKISTTLGVDVEKLTQKISGELGVCWMESKGPSLSKVLIINSKSSTDDWIKTFNTLSQKLSIDTVFYEKFSEYEIRELPLYRFPEKILSPLVSGFNTSYYTSLGDAIFIGENLEELKRFLEDIDREDTWGKSVAQNQFLESTLLESNVSVYINTPRIWSALESTLHPKWKRFVQENRSLVRSLGMGAIQFSHLNDSYYTNISWNYRQGSQPAETERVVSDKILTNFNETLAKIFVVRSHVSRSDEILVQDSSRNIRLIASDGKVLWKLPVDGFITGDVEQVDYFNNGKIQFFFATPGALHIIDRLGNYVNPFPVKIKEREVEFVSIVDYDHSKKYRFLVAGKSGKLWMYDKTGVNLEGWQPKDIGESLFAPARHYRIRGKDYVIAIREDGNVYLMNRRGELLKGFPLNLNARPSGEYYLESGNSLQTTYFVLVSRDGFRIKFTTDGKIHSRETLLKNTVDARFSLVNEKDSKSYLVLRQEPKQLTLFDDNLKQIITSDFLGNNSANVQYLDFGAGKIYVAITDIVQDLSFVYDSQGGLLTQVPVESCAIAVKPLDFEKLRLFSILDKTLTIAPL